MRLPPLTPAQLDDQQRDLYATFDRQVASEEFTGMTVKDGETFLGPWSVLLHFPEIGDRLTRLTQAIGRLEGLSATARQVVTLAVGGALNPAYELDAHTVAATRAGLSPEQISSLGAGGRPADLTPEEGLAADITRCLLRGGPLPRTVWQAAKDQLGDGGFDAVVFLAAQYQFISTLLNAYDVPGAPT